MRKYRPPLTKNELEELKRLTILSFDGWTEADIREEFVVPLLKLLGYRKELDYSVSREESFRLNPLFLQIGRDRIKLDYICSVRKQRFWIIESKPGKLLKDDTYPKLLLEDIAQAHFYSMHPDIDAKYFVVTNGWLLDLYDRDKFNERMEPILSIKHTELEREFLKLDSYIGASQIIFTLKSKILKDIENTLRSEVYIDRLDEFVDAVKLKVSKVRPIVLDNFRRNAKIQKDIIEKEFNDFLLKEDLDFIVSSLFMSNPPAINLYKTSRIAAERFINEPSAKQYLFLHRLLLKEPRAVLYPYYYYVLVFLIELKKLGMKVLRGIWLSRKNEVQWLYQEGASRFYPEVWEEYLKPIPEHKRNDIVKAYYDIFTKGEEEKQMEAAKAWSAWEGSISKLIPSKDLIESFSDPNNAIAIAKIECHYFVNNMFAKSDNFVIENAHKISHIPTIIVNGRYDLVCPIYTAWELHKALPKSKFIVVDDAGHSATEPGIVSELVKATEEYKELY